MIRIAVRIVLVLVALVAVAAGTFVYLFQRGSAGIDDWVVRQVISIAEAYIVPKIHFTSFDYRAPGELELQDVTFTALDATEVIRAQRLVITLAETPRVGRPMVIRSVSIEDAILRLIRPEEGAAPPGTLFKGLAPFARTENIRDQSKVDRNVRLSEVLQIRELSLVKGAVEYVEAGGAPPMTLTDLNLTLTLEPVESGAEAGWYAVKTALTRPPVFDLDVTGRINLDTMAVEMAPLRMRMDLVEETYPSLPPQLQEVLRRHDAVGKLEAHLQGTIFGRELAESQLRAGLWIDTLEFGMGEYRLPVDEGRFELTLKEQQVAFERATLDMLQGNVKLEFAEADLSRPEIPAYIAWTIEGIKLQELLRAHVQRQAPPRFAGTVISSGEATLRLADGVQSLDGRGTIALTDGLLVDLPIVRELAAAMDLAVSMVRKPRLDDTAVVEFDLRNEQVVIHTLDLRSQVIAARGGGTIGFDKTVNLELNGGPLEKVQSLLGPIGKAIGKFTDALMKYRVTGRIGDLRVGVRPLGM